VKAEAERDLSESSLALASDIVGGLGTWSRDLGTGKTTWSDSLFDLLGIPKGTPPSGQEFIELVHPDDRRGVEDRLKRIDSLSEVQVNDFRVVRPADGRVCWVESRFRVVRSPSGEAQHLVGVMYDVSRYKSLEQELERRVVARTRQLASANEELEAFTYSASHDLRAPLRGIDGFAKVLAEDYGDRLDDEGLHHVERIRKAANRLSELIDGFLLLSKTTSEALNVERVNLSQLAHLVVNDLRERSPEREANVTIAPDLVVSADKSLLRIVLENLIGNAFKFTVDAPVQVEVGAQQFDDETAFYVRDNGVGFDMRYSQKLFIPFQRLHDSVIEGSGVGLATVQRIVNKHGGRVWAESKPGEGATFYFSLNSH
jgi:signal transduction histidine kinase